MCLHMVPDAKETQPAAAFKCDDDDDRCTNISRLSDEGQSNTNAACPHALWHRNYGLK